MSFGPYPYPYSYAGGNGWGWGYLCNGCGAWVGNGSLHACVRYMPTLPPPAQPFITIQPGISEERVRELIDEALEKFRKDGVKRARRNG